MGTSTFQQVKTYSDDNQFSFTCPIFNAATKITTCLALREEVWTGKGHEKRKGCQACMASSKCPVVKIMTEIQNKGTDPYFSAEPKVGKLHERHLQQILPIIVSHRDLEQRSVPQIERDLIDSANDRIRAQLGKNAPDDDYSPTEADLTRRTVARKSRVKASTKSAPETAAAETGDMTAAINQAMNG